MSDRAARTFRFDCLRAPFEGVLEPGWVVLSLVVLIRHYDAPVFLKSLIASANFIGLMLTPFSRDDAARVRRPALQHAGFYLAISSGFLLLAGLLPGLYAFAGFVFFGALVRVQAVPLMTTVYSRNYLPIERGRRLSTVAIVSAAGGSLASYLGGAYLEHDASRYPTVYVVLGVASLVAMTLLMQIPSEPLPRRPGAKPWHNLALPFKDGLFGWMLAGWMLLGLGNLVTIPLRVEYLAAPQYGIAASNKTILLITFVVPVMGRLVSARFWGILFDRLNFALWRVIVNAMFVGSFVLYFNSTQLWVITIGAALLGVGMGGGMIGWQLWITKLAPPERVSDYMSIHTLCTGLRGMIAPWIGYALIEAISPSGVSVFSTVLLLVSSAMFLSIRHNRRLTGGNHA